MPATASAPWSFEATPGPVNGSNPLLESVSCAQSACAAVGWYANNQSGHPAPLTEVWNGSAWRITATPAAPAGFGGTYSGVACASAARCLAVGLGYQDFDGFSAGPIATLWNGTAWSVLAVPDPAGRSNGFAAVSCASAATCTAVGSSKEPLVFPQTEHPLAAQWNGSAWTFRPVPVPANVTSARLAGVSCPTADRCTAVGSYVLPHSSTVLPLVERWNGARWATQPVPVAARASSTALSAVSCVGVSRCTAVGGSYATYGGPAAPLVLAWNGASWQAQAVPGTPSDTSLAGVSCRSATDCVAVGASHTGAQRTTALAVRLSVAGWRVEPTAVPAADRALADVSCTTAGCHAVGWTLTDPVSLVYSTLAERRP